MARGVTKWGEPKDRTGPGMVQVVVYVNRDELAEFDGNVGKGNRSHTIRALITAHNWVNRERKGE